MGIEKNNYLQSKFKYYGTAKRKDGKPQWAAKRNT